MHGDAERVGVGLLTLLPYLVKHVVEGVGYDAAQIGRIFLALHRVALASARLAVGKHRACNLRLGTTGINGVLDDAAKSTLSLCGYVQWKCSRTGQLKDKRLGMRCRRLAIAGLQAHLKSH